jgi:hypothetical protein
MVYNGAEWNRVGQGIYQNIIKTKDCGVGWYKAIHLFNAVWGHHLFFIN